MKSEPTKGPWQRRAIPGHLFEINDGNGNIVLRLRGGMVPMLADARLLAGAWEMFDILRNVAAHFDAVGEDDEAIAASVRRVLREVSE